MLCWKAGSCFIKRIALLAAAENLQSTVCQKQYFHNQLALPLSPTHALVYLTAVELSTVAWAHLETTVHAPTL